MNSYKARIRKLRQRMSGVEPLVISLNNAGATSSDSDKRLFKKVWSYLYKLNNQVIRLERQYAKKNGLDRMPALSRGGFKMEAEARRLYKTVGPDAAKQYIQGYLQELKSKSGI